MHTCKECGILEKNNYGIKLAKQMEDNQLCFDCNFWYNLIAINTEPNIVISNNHHYMIEPDKPKDYKGFLGFGGREFIIEFNDGRKVTTHNLGYQGEIPERFRDKLKNNAKFIKKD